MSKNIIDNLILKEGFFVRRRDTFHKIVSYLGVGVEEISLGNVAPAAEGTKTEVVVLEPPKGQLYNVIPLVEAYTIDATVPPADAPPSIKREAQSCNIKVYLPTQAPNNILYETTVVKGFNHFDSGLENPSDAFSFWLMHTEKPWFQARNPTRNTLNITQWIRCIVPKYKIVVATEYTPEKPPANWKRIPDYSVEEKK